MSIGDIAKEEYEQKIWDIEVNRLKCRWMN